ncbi:MAG TPA: hypothetical protein PKY77_01170 [Phycisphaerae bacterium]|nr:hypothetical protein [Phycisphaerae bacterium]HRY67532.1 hypothetical protein [Phycisphaerae bacterium]HSA24919.1 hypothetical protein [Phycisphaerae bacterium]
MRKRVLITAAVGVLWCQSVLAEVTLDLGTGRLVLDDRGCVAGLFLGDRGIGLAGSQPVMMIETDRGEQHPQTLSWQDDRLIALFEGGASAEWSVARHAGFVLLRLTKLSCDRPVKRLRVVALPVPDGARVAHTLNAAYTGEWTIAVMATDPNVHAEPGQLAARANRSESRPSETASLLSLIAETYDRHGIEPAGAAIAVCPTSQWIETLQRLEAAAGLPTPRPGNEWNKRSPWIDRSYLFLTSFDESQFDRALALARRGGFHMILLGQESWCETTGHYQVNRKHFPDGVEGLRRTINRFREAGFHVGLHLLAASIYPPDAYLTPIPDQRLVRDAFGTLAADIDENAVFVPVTMAPRDFPNEDGGYEGPGSVLQIGDELVWYTARRMQAPWGFEQCQRGHLGTKAAAHSRGERVAHVRKAYGYFLYDMDTSILGEIAENFSKVANAVNAEMLYFDGSERLQGDHWYYNALLHKTIYDKLSNKNVLLQASSFSHYSWHLLARSASADGHGDIKGYLDERSSWFDSFARDGMPLDIGWYYGYDPMATIDQFEYVLGTTIGYGASMSFQVSVDAADRHPFTADILDLIARYEKLRLSGRVSPEMRQRLRVDPALAVKMEPALRLARLGQRREYRLLDTPPGQVFQRVVYEPWRDVSRVDGKENVWKVRIGQSETRCGVQIQALSGPWLEAGPAYSAPGAVTLEDFASLEPYEPGERATLQQVTQKLELGVEKGPGGSGCAVYTAVSDRSGADGWSYIGRRFNPPLDLARHRGIGFWLRGDGNGGAFKIQLRDEKGATDYYIQNNFNGWHYQQLDRPAKDPIDYRQVRCLGLYYNSLPGRKTVSCGIGGIKALPVLDKRTIKDPWIEFAGRRWTWKGELEEGQYLLLWPGEPIRRFGPPLNEPQASPQEADEHVLGAGDYQARVGCAGGLLLPLRVRLTMQPPERHGIN